MARVRALVTRARKLAAAEWGPLYRAVREGIAADRWRAIPVTLAAVCLTALLHYVQNHGPAGYRFVQDIGSVRAEDPLWLALLRTPLSLFVPALDLPAWGALGQLLLVFGIAEITLGRRRMLALAYAATLAGTLYARLGIRLGEDRPLGLPASYAQVVDTGPSAAVVGLAVCVCWRHRAWFTMAVVIGAMAVELVVEDNLAGREHLAAILVVLVLCGVSEWRQPRSSGAGPFGSGSKRPPRSS
ncbi:hypothetical protein [Streptomyces sp. KLOTTS4A1]|uniref:hypothetical protein n=1 Tax=Streptomyces sp. KLOTTS4A1 TaxID=3390996 RepID=UPI0039F572CC